MAVIFVDLDEVYKPKSQDQPITVSVLIGDGQIGAYLIFLDDEVKGANKDTLIGTGKEVSDKTTLVSTTIPDTLKETNWTSVTVQFKEGGKTTRFGPYRKQVPADRDTAIFSLKVVHK